MGSRPVHIAEDVLRRMYCDEKLSVGKIAKHFDCTIATVKKRMVGYAIPLRSTAEALAIRDNLSMTAEALRQLYVEEKLSQSAIAARYGCSQVAIKRHMAKYGITARGRAEANLLHNHSFRRDFDGPLSLKAYMLGFCKGDVHPWVRGEQSETIRLMTATTRQAQIDLFHGLFSPYGHLYLSQPDTRQATHMAAHLNFSFRFLLDREDSVPEWVLADEEAFFGFLAGYTDAEGHIGHYGEYATYFKIDTYDKNIIHTCATTLQAYGISTSTPCITAHQNSVHKNGHRYHQDMWRLHVSAKAALQTLFGRLQPYLRHATRIQQMQAALEHIAYRNSRPRKNSRKENAAS